MAHLENYAAEDAAVAAIYWLAAVQGQLVRNGVITQDQAQSIAMSAATSSKESGYPGVSAFLERFAVIACASPGHHESSPLYGSRNDN